MTLKGILYIWVLFAVIGIAHADNLINDYADLDFSNMKQYHREIARDTGHSDIFGFETNIWQFTDIPLDDGEVDYTDDFWMPIEPWEYQVCSRGLSTQLKDDTNEEVTAAGGGIYATAATVAAYKRIASNNDTFLYEITWYFQPAGSDDTGRHYTVDARGPVDSINIQPSKGVTRRLGDQGYVAFYDAKNYTAIILRYQRTDHSYPIIEVPDENRQY